MAAAERAGAVALRRGKRERGHLIDRVTVKDQVLLAQHLGPGSIFGNCAEGQGGIASDRRDRRGMGEDRSR